MRDQKQWKIRIQRGRQYCIYHRFGDALEDIKTAMEEDSEGTETTIKVIKMTDKELEREPEFEGW